jgi:hypothetical protein
MKVFISWSGHRSNQVATALRSFLEDVNQRIEPWMSEVDIKAGTRWGVELGMQLQDTDYGIVCITPESITSSWLMFEAGALSKSVKESRVCPYLIGISSRELRDGPLSQFQYAEATRDSTWRVLLQINEAMGKEAIQESRLRRYFDNFWPTLDNEIQRILNSPVAAQMQKSDYEAALEEFFLIDPALDEIGDLQTKESNIFYDEIGVRKIFQEECRNIDLARLEFMGSLGRFHRPFFGAGDVRPLLAYYRYLLMVEDWEYLPLFHINIDTLRKSLREFLGANSAIRELSTVYVGGSRDEAHEEKYKADPYFLPDKGNADLMVLSPEGDGTLIPIGGDTKISYDKITNLKPESVSKMLRKKRLIVGENEKKEALPCLRRVWDVVGDLDMGVVEQALARRIREEKR